MISDTTKKLTAVQTMNEKEYAQYKYDKAKERMLKDRSQQHIDEFIEASKELTYTLSAYELAGQLLKERALALKNAIYLAFRG